MAAEVQTPQIILDLAVMAGSLVTIGGCAVAVWKYALGPSGRWTMGWVKTIQELVRRINVIYANVTPNGGNSLADQMTLMHIRLSQLERSRELMMGLFDVGFARADSAGQWYTASRTLSRQTGKTDDELTRRGWYNSIAPRDRDHVVSSWLRAVKDQRELAVEFNWRHAESQELVPVYMEAWPMSTDPKDPHVTGYVVAVRGLDHKMPRIPTT